VHYYVEIKVPQIIFGTTLRRSTGQSRQGDLAKKWRLLSDEECWDTVVEILQQI